MWKGERAKGKEEQDDSEGESSERAGECSFWGEVASSEVCGVKGCAERESRCEEHHLERGETN